MVAPKIPDADFMELYPKLGLTKLAAQLGQTQSRVAHRRRGIEKKHGIVLDGPRTPERFQRLDVPNRLQLTVKTGPVLVGSDLHAWPGSASTAFRAFVELIKDMRPKVIILNGDVIDGAGISRHPPLGWSRLPTLIEEIEAAQERLHEIEMAAPKDAQLIWPAGNHDARFAVRLATVAPEYARLHGTQLADHFGSRWKSCWSCWINDDVVVKHRARGGVHASYNSTVYAGKTLVHGHLHSLKVTPFSDYRGRRYGVDCGTLADPWGPQFDYLEDGVRNWSAGCAVLTFKNSFLTWPEVLAVCGPDRVEFRGEVWTV